MKYIIAGTDRPDSNTLKVAKYVQSLYSSLGETTEIIDLRAAKEHLHADLQYGKQSEGMRPYMDKVLTSDGLIVVCPEYNGSMPGVLKYFIDHLKFPESFEYRPVCFIGIGGMFGGLRPVEHLQQIFGYRNAFIFPECVFIMNVFKIFNAEGQPTDDLIKQLLLRQAQGFQKFSKALAGAKLDANSFIESKKS
ncbi:FMN-dependent NADPH-azoreductase [compost metagenome]